MEIVKEQNFNFYKTIMNDTWDWIAYKIWGDSSYTKDLYLVNPEFTSIVFFPPNIMLKVPDIKKLENEVLPPWVTT